MRKRYKKLLKFWADWVFYCFIASLIINLFVPGIYWTIFPIAFLIICIVCLVLFLLIIIYYNFKIKRREI